MLKYKDIQGQTFADLTAVRYLGSDKVGNANWLFSCVCGKEIEYIAKKVLKGDALSCGCRRYRNCKIPKLCIHCNLPSARKNRHGNMASVCQKCYNKQTNDFKVFNPKQRMMASARNRSRACGIPCTITHRDFEIPEYCPIFGIKLEYGTSENHNASPSLDRIVPHLGYVPGNIGVISHRANQIKNNGTAEEHRKIAEWIEQNQPEGHHEPPARLSQSAKPKTVAKITTIIFSDAHREKLRLVASKRWGKETRSRRHRSPFCIVHFLDKINSQTPNNSLLVCV